VRNLSPAPQTFTVIDPIPANTTYLSGNYYNTATKSIVWTGTVSPNQTKVSVFSVTVNTSTPKSTQIKNNATLFDDALGSNASVTTVVK
jgi:hypothetical protein